MRKLYAILALALLFQLPAQALQRENALSEREVEKLRDTASIPSDRVLVFVGFLDDRIKDIDRLTTGKRKPGREEDIHDRMQQFASIAEDLDDNLDDYSKHHRDLRKALPKLIAATDHWATVLKSPPNDDSYNVARALALEDLKDIHDAAIKLLAEQRIYFAAHPPDKEDNRSLNSDRPPSKPF